MLKLTKSEGIEVWEVQAVIARKRYEHPFVALLMAAAEIEDQGEWITPEEIHERLVVELPLPVVRNLLLRLSFMQLLHLEGPEEYSLTEIGRIGAIDQSVWLEEEGVYRIGIVKSPFIPQKIVFVNEVQAAKHEEEPTGERLPSYFYDFLNQELSLQNQDIQILHIESRCHSFPELRAKLTLEFEAKNGVLNLSESKTKLDYSMQLPNYSEDDVRRAILKMEFGSSFLEKEDLITVEFDPQNMELIRDVEVMKPQVKNVYFDKIKLPNIQYGPTSQSAADKWLLNLSVARMNRYFMDDDDFDAYLENIAGEFIGPYHPKSFPRAQMVQILKGNGKLFYRLAKVETIDYLNY